MVQRRLDWLAAHPEDRQDRDPRGLVYTPMSLGVPHHIKHGAGSGMVTNIIKRAGLSKVPGFRALSLQEYVAKDVYDKTGSVEQAAVRLGMRSLDSVADLIDLDWRDAHRLGGPPGVDRTPEETTYGRRRAPDPQPDAG